jgi:Mg/Co/Ni transporter MgtE
VAREVPESKVAEVLYSADYRAVVALLDKLPGEEADRVLRIMKPHTAAKILSTRHPDLAVKWLESLGHDHLVAMVFALTDAIFSPDLDDERKMTLRLILPRVD